MWPHGLLNSSPLSLPPSLAHTIQDCSVSTSFLKSNPIPLANFPFRDCGQGVKNCLHLKKQLPKVYGKHLSLPCLFSGLTSAEMGVPFSKESHHSTSPINSLSMGGNWSNLKGSELTGSISRKTDLPVGKAIHQVSWYC